MATYKDIQRLTGLSLATISKHYNGGTVLDDNRLAIEEAAESLGYRMNTVARDLRRGRSRTVGVLLPSLANAFHLSIVDGIERDLRSDGISVIVTSTADESADHRSVDLLLGRRVDAIVAVPAQEVVASLSLAIAAGVPVVCVDWEADDLDSDLVVLDNRRAGRLAARHLLDHGHRRIGLIGGLDSVSTLHDRALGFLEPLREAGVAPAAELLTAGPLTVEQGLAALQSLLGLDERPTAVFTVNHELTVGALIGVNESGLRLGVDVSMVGFDDTDLARVTQPRLTVVQQPVDDIARTAARIVRQRLDRSGEPGSVTHRLKASLVAGASVASLHRDAAR